jgi:hypothetical protein
VGLWTSSSLISFPLALASNHLFPYVASSNRPGSTFMMYLVNTIPMLIGAILAGIGAALLLLTRHPRAWAIALTILITGQFIASYFGWHWVRLGRETRMALGVTSALIMVSVLGGFAFGTWSLRRSGDVRSA